MAFDNWKNPYILFTIRIKHLEEIMNFMIRQRYDCFIIFFMVCYYLSIDLFALLMFLIIDSYSDYWMQSY